TAHGLEVAFGLRPFDILSGDFFDYSLTKHDTLVAMGDAMGKGTMAALWAAYVLGKFRALCERIRDPQQLTAQLNRLIHRARKAGSEYTTLVVCRWQPNRNVVTICNAGNHPPYLLRKGTVAIVGRTNKAVGMFLKTRFTAFQLKPRKGDIVI